MPLRGLPISWHYDGEDWRAACAVRNAWLAAAEASQRVLDHTTIQDLLEQQSQIRANRTERPAEGMPLPAPVLLSTDH